MWPNTLWKSGEFCFFFSETSDSLKKNMTKIKQWEDPINIIQVFLFFNILQPFFRTFRTHSATLGSTKKTKTNVTHCHSLSQLCSGGCPIYSQSRRQKLSQLSKMLQQRSCIIRPGRQTSVFISRNQDTNIMQRNTKDATKYTPEV